MPSLGVTANTSAQTIAAERLDRKYKLLSLTVDNDAGSADQIVRLQDIFTPAVTNGVSGPTEQTVDRFRATVLQGDVVTWNKHDLEGIEFLGALKALGDSIDASCFITAGYEPV